MATFQSVKKFFLLVLTLACFNFRFSIQNIFFLLFKLLLLQKKQHIDHIVCFYTSLQHFQHKIALTSNLNWNLNFISLPISILTHLNSPKSIKWFFGIVSFQWVCANFRADFTNSSIFNGFTIDSIFEASFLHNFCCI